MDEQDKKLMAEYGITAENKVIFHYGCYRYERLADAVNYARTQEAMHTAKGTALDPGSHGD